MRDLQHTRLQILSFSYMCPLTHLSSEVITMNRSPLTMRSALPLGLSKSHISLPSQSSLYSIFENM